MKLLDAETIWERARPFYADLLKLGLSLSTGILAALSLIVLQDKKPAFTPAGVWWYKAALITMAIATIFAIIGWAAQAAYYSAWAYNFPDDNEKRRKKWRITRNISLGLFVISFILGVLAAAVFVFDFIPA